MKVEVTRISNQSLGKIGSECGDRESISKTIEREYLALKILLKEAV